MGFVLFLFVEVSVPFSRFGDFGDGRNRPRSLSMVLLLLMVVCAEECIGDRMGKLAVGRL